MVPLLNSLDLSTMGFLVGLWPMYQFNSYFTIFVPIELCISLVLASWCALDNCKELSLNSGTTRLYLLCDALF